MEKKKANIKQFDKEHAPTKANATINTSSKTFYIDALKKMTDSHIITGYTRDKLLGILENGKKRDYSRFKKHFHDLLDLHDSFRRRPIMN